VLGGPERFENRMRTGCHPVCSDRKFTGFCQGNLRRRK
jgi:hypothetical protein